MIWNKLEKYRDVGLLIARLGFGLGFLYFHGWDKLVGGPERWAGVGGAMDSVGIGFGHTFFGFMAAFSEAVGGILIAAGLFFRPVCVLLCLTMIVAASNHIVTGRGNPGHAVKNVALFIGLMLIGPGKYSLDYVIQQKLQGRNTQ
jgi:putative oxidoreductase